MIFLLLQFLSALFFLNIPLIIPLTYHSYQLFCQQTLWFIICNCISMYISISYENKIEYHDFTLYCTSRTLCQRWQILWKLHMLSAKLQIPFHSLHSVLYFVMNNYAMDSIWACMDFPSAGCMRHIEFATKVRCYLYYVLSEDIFSL